jgi:integrase
MAARREKTRTPGIYRRGDRYTFSYKVDGKQYWESARTLDEARRAKAVRTADIARGEFEERSRITLHDYAREWVKRYQGRGRRGFRDHTREEYERMLEAYPLKFFSARVRLTEITPSKVAEFVAWLCEQTKPAPTKESPDRRDLLSDKTIRNVMGPLRACLATAVREGLIRSNPSREVDLPHRPTAEDVEDEEVKAMSREELTALLGQFPETWRVFFWLLAATGLRISEAIALQWRHLDLDASSPHVKVRRGVVRGRLGPPKSRHARREVPLDHALVLALRDRHEATEWPGDDDLVFPAGNGAYLHVGNTRRRVLKPVRERACLEWVGFHTFRHTCATLLFAEGRNAVQVQRWLGHHSAAFTLARYVHLLDGDLGEPLTVQGGNPVVTGPTLLDTTTSEEPEANPQR